MTFVQVKVLVPGTRVLVKEYAGLNIWKTVQKIFLLQFLVGVYFSERKQHYKRCFRRNI